MGIDDVAHELYGLVPEEFTAARNAKVKEAKAAGDAELAAAVPLTGAKVAPGIPHEAVPAGAEAEWVSVGGEVKEAALWFGPLATATRRATACAPKPSTPRRAAPFFPVRPRHDPNSRSGRECPDRTRRGGMRA